MILPTPRLALAVGGATALFAAAVGFPALSPVAWGADLLLAAAIALEVVRCPRPRRILVHRVAPQRVARGEPFVIVYRVECASRVAELRIADEAPASVEVLEAPPAVVLAPGEATAVTSRAVARERGDWTFGDLHVRALSPLGLLVRTLRVAQPQGLRVDPVPARLRESLRRVRAQMRQLGATTVRLRGRATEFEQLRDFVEGDEFRAMDWKATARRGLLTVRDHRAERNREVSIVVDAGRRMAERFSGATKLDHALEAALGLARAALEAGDRVGIVLFDATIRVEVPPARGLAQYRRILEATRGIRASEAESNLVAALRHHRVRHRRRAFVLLVTDLVDPVSAARWVPALSAAARRHRLLLVAVDDPQRRATEDRMPEDVRDVWLVAGARRLRTERVQVLAELRRHGVASADVLPWEISGPSLDAYLAAAGAEAF